jgi:ferric-dicitrate binding protein FerR (iron transport regulator)
MSPPTRDLLRRLARDQDAALARGDATVPASSSETWEPRRNSTLSTSGPRRRLVALLGAATTAAAVAALVVAVVTHERGPARPDAPAAAVAMVGANVPANGSHARKGDGTGDLGNGNGNGNGNGERDVAGGVPDQALLTDAHSDLPLQLPDGSTVTLGSGSAGRMRRLTDTRVDLFLDHGLLEAHVVHAESTLWLVHAGPFRVRVTGTRFAVRWSAPTLQVEVYEGAVSVEGASSGSAVPLRAGHRLTIDDDVLRTEALGPEAPPRPSVVATASPATPEADWQSLAGRGAFGSAYAAAARHGWRSLCGHLDARRLLLLGDVARYAGAGNDARRAFESLVARFPDDSLAADAVFSLGRMAFDANQPADASRWFERYLADWPRAPLAEQALGRLIECALRADDVEAARAAARGYLRRAPNGPRARFARDLLQGSAVP